MSIVIPTYNEAENISRLIEAIKDNLPSGIFTEIIVVDDNSPDGTGKIVETYTQNNNNSATKKSSLQRQDQKQEQNVLEINSNKNCSVKVINRENRNGLIPAILQGISSSGGDYILVMDADFSHSPENIPRMIEELLHNPDQIVVASRYVKGSSVVGWPVKRKIISRCANIIARYVLRLCNITDPMSGFFAFRRHLIENVTIDTSGYKLLLELLVKVNGGNTRVREIPYTFTDRQSGRSKMDNGVMIDYIKAVWHLYRYGQKSKQTTEQNKEKRKSILFLSKAGRFFTIGASGLLVNYVISYLLSNGILANLWYVQATGIGIICSITSNFFLNKAWTFEDRNFSARHTLRQYGLFFGMSSIGAALQLAILYFLVESADMKYEVSLILAVAIASMSNFLLNKKWTFREKVWG
ncbi:MAG: glycosyltransferase family 2 protein [Nitrososphaeraceae archaeon]|nr:glycosyltransferase family 2 protein [Nitrososphaeraceae archaeon]